MPENWTKVRQQLPPWIKKTAGDYAATQAIREKVRDQGIWTVCTEANCPNVSECWASKHCTFLILGNECTRWCGYCSVPKALRPQMQHFTREQAEVVRSIRQLDARYVVLTSPNRDDLPQGGALAWADQIQAIHDAAPEVLVEVLIPDFDFDAAAWDSVIQSGIAVLGHNVEAVPELFPTVRPHGDFYRALGALAAARSRWPEQITKTALICGLGETEAQLEHAITEIAAAGIDILVLGQYLRPTMKQVPVSRFVTPAEFAALEDCARSVGISTVVAGPFVRSSYKAQSAWEAACRYRGIPGPGVVDQTNVQQRWETEQSEEL